MATEQATRGVWTALPDAPSGPLHLSLHPQWGASASEHVLHGALGTSIPSHWISPRSFELAFGHLGVLRRDPVHVDPDAVVVRERGERMVLEFTVRIPPVVPRAARLHRVPSVAEAATEVKGLSGLTDEALAAVFPVTREHFSRWRHGVEGSPNEENLRQLLTVRHLLRDLSGRIEPVKDWLLSPVDDVPGAMSPYELLRRARLEDVWHLVEALPSREKPHYHLDEEGGWTATASTAVPYDHAPDDSPSIPLDWDDED